MSMRVICFGEIMMRLSPPGNLRFSQARNFDLIYGGGEANVAVSLAGFGLPVSYLTRLPDHDLGRACASFVAGYGVDVSHIVYGGERLGIYFLENGAMQRGSKVIYDRAGSSLATIQPGQIDWPRVLEGAGWFHWTGITPAISETAAQVCLEGVRTAGEMGLTISCDLNYRAKLWKWGKSASQVMPELVALSHIAVGNEEDADKVFGIKAPKTDITSGRVEGENYKTVARELMERFPNLTGAAITLRGSLSASHNAWSGLYYDGQEYYLSPVHQLTHIVDRVGGGDAFAAGLIHGLIKHPDQPQRVIDFAVAASALKHSILGDFNLISVSEAEKLMVGDSSGRVSR